MELPGHAGNLLPLTGHMPHYGMYAPPVVAYIHYNPVKAGRVGRRIGLGQGRGNSRGQLE
jgi:hypothetical protein